MWIVTDPDAFVSRTINLVHKFQFTSNLSLPWEMSLDFPGNNVEKFLLSCQIFFYKFQKYGLRYIVNL